MDDEIKINPLELARIIGEPIDPRRPFPTIVTMLAETDFADPNEFVFQYDSLQNVEQVINISSTGELAQEVVTPDSPVLLSFVDVSTPDFFAKLTDLANAKERTVARKKRTIERSLNSFEEFKIVQLLEAAATAEGNLNTLTSGETKFRFPNLIAMIDDIHDFGDQFVLVHGNQIWEDITLWDFDDNKFSSPIDAIRDMGVERVRMPSTMQFKFADDGSAGGLVDTDVLGTNVAFLVAKESGEDGLKPLLWVRKRISNLDVLGGAVQSIDGERPQRIVVIGQAPINVAASGQRFLAFSFTGYEQIAASVRNPKAITKFTRS